MATPILVKLLDALLVGCGLRNIGNVTVTTWAKYLIVWRGGQTVFLMPTVMALSVRMLLDMELVIGTS